MKTSRKHSLHFFSNHIAGNLLRSEIRPVPTSVFNIYDCFPIPVLLPLRLFKIASLVFFHSCDTLVTPLDLYFLVAGNNKMVYLLKLDYLLSLMHLVKNT